MKRLAVLGATGSIGKSTLDILREKKECFKPVLFSANKNSSELLRLKKEFPLALTALSLSDDESFFTSSKIAAILPHGIDFSGKQGLLDAIAASKADITVNGISGAAGLEPSYAVLKAGSDLALANKETLVMAGKLILDLAREKNRRVIPVDSEHSALFKLITAHGADNVSEIILTASGGPFKNHTMEQLKNITPQEALAHPTWNMGAKISLDSATLANKGLEVIEASVLFDLPPEKIKVVIHPQSIVHSMVRLKNGAVYAQMSKPDMKLPIHDALTWPVTEDTPYGQLDFDSLNLTFTRYDAEKFPMLDLAYKALCSGLAIAYNAANEIAVAAFFRGKISFLEIGGVVEYVINISKLFQSGKQTIETVLEQDKEARKLAIEYISTGSVR